MEVESEIDPFEECLFEYRIDFGPNWKGAVQFAHRQARRAAARGRLHTAGHWERIAKACKERGPLIPYSEPV